MLLQGADLCVVQHQRPSWVRHVSDARELQVLESVFQCQRPVLHPRLPRSRHSPVLPGGDGKWGNKWEKSNPHQDKRRRHNPKKDLKFWKQTVEVLQNNLDLNLKIFAVLVARHVFEILFSQTFKSSKKNWLEEITHFGCKNPVFSWMSAWGLSKNPPNLFSVETSRMSRHQCMGFFTEKRFHVPENALDQLMQVEALAKTRKHFVRADGQRGLSEFFAEWSSSCVYFCRGFAGGKYTIKSCHFW